jgi:hypothetical protein
LKLIIQQVFINYFVSLKCHCLVFTAKNDWEASRIFICICAELRSKDETTANGCCFLCQQYYELIFFRRRFLDGRKLSLPLL